MRLALLLLSLIGSVAFATEESTVVPQASAGGAAATVPAVVAPAVPTVVIAANSPEPTTDLSAQKILAMQDKLEPAKPVRKYFNSYIVRAVNYLNKKYGLLGYRLDATFTHNLEYGDKGVVTSTHGGPTMCVAAVMETILTAMQIYADDTEDQSVWNFLPVESWKAYRPDAIRAHLWVDEVKLKSFGTADALTRFGMGEHIPYDELTPGSFANLNFEAGFGHAVVFMNWIDENGKAQDDFLPKKTAGMRFFSAQGTAEKGKGGLGFAYAIFSDRPCTLEKENELVFCGMLRSENPKLLNTGRMFSPALWQRPKDQVLK